MKVSYPQINVTNQALVSDSIRDIVPEDTFEQKNLDDIVSSYILNTIYMTISNSVAIPLTGITKSIVLGDVIEIGSKVSIDDAMSALKEWKNATIESINLRLADNEITVHGPLDISSLGINDIDSNERMAVLTMTLSNKKNVI